MTARQFIIKKLEDVEKVANTINCYYVVVFWNSPKKIDDYLNCIVGYFDTWIEAQRWYEDNMEKRNSFVKNDMPFSIRSSYEHYEHPDFVADIDRTLLRKNLTYLK